MDRIREFVSKYGIAFSVTNCAFSIGLSAVMNKRGSPRQKWFAVFWFVMGVTPPLVKTTDNEIVFKGMTHIPALTSDTFGNDEVGFAFGVVQIGSLPRRQSP